MRWKPDGRLQLSGTQRGWLLIIGAAVVLALVLQPK